MNIKVNQSQDQHPNKTSFFFAVAINVPLFQTFTYQYPLDIAIGSRVSVYFRNKLQCGVIIGTLAKPNYDVSKIKPIVSVLDSTPIFSRAWLALLHFTSTYYLYPIGQTIFNALPPKLKQLQVVVYPPKKLVYKLNSKQKNTNPPHPRFFQLNLLWKTLLENFLSIDEALFIHPKAKQYIEKYRLEGILEEQEWQPKNWQYRNKLLNQEQQLASNQIKANLNNFSPYLLFGITGSGKTEIYFDVINEIVQRKKQVLMLLPIINLTPQFFNRIKQTFPQANIVLLHSKISDKVRADNYLNASNGKVQIIVGTRLAIFTPIPNLGLIIVDEEHEDSFKQENDLRYQARDLAVWRAQQVNCPVILGSATPSMRSWYQVKLGRYQLLKLTQKAASKSLKPEIKLINTKQQKLQQGFSEQALQSIQNNLEKKQLTLIYLNRRGFAPAVVCMDCGFIIKCDFCSAKMVYHKEKNKLICHHCDFEINIPDACPSCGNQDLSFLGLGTERVEESIKNFFPNANLVRVDSDSLLHRHSWESIYEQILDNKIDIIIGTQLLAKGHDFSKISLVVVFDVDQGLFSADYRANEKLFSELMQVSGRAGRGDIPGQVLIQTQFPEHEIFTALKLQDYPLFADKHLQELIELHFPPQSFRIIIKAEHQYFHNAEQFLQNFKAYLNLPNGIQIIGPLAMNPLKLAGRERAIIYFNSENRQTLHQTLKNNLHLLYALQAHDRKLKWSIDVDSNEA